MTLILDTSSPWRRMTSLKRFCENRVQVKKWCLRWFVSALMKGLYMYVLNRHKSFPSVKTELKNNFRNYNNFTVFISGHSEQQKLAWTHLLYCHVLEIRVKCSELRWVHKVHVSTKDKKCVSENEFTKTWISYSTISETTGFNTPAAPAAPPAHGSSKIKYKKKKKLLQQNNQHGRALSNTAESRGRKRKFAESLETHICHLEDCEDK